MSGILDQEKWDHLSVRIQRLEGKPEDVFRFASVSPRMSHVQEWLSSLRKDAMRGEPEEPVIHITGEAGTEKEGVARMVYSTSRRGRGPWVSVNCADYPGRLLEAELFGFEKDAFEGADQSRPGAIEITEGGTVYLSNLETMDLHLQEKFIKFLQDNTFSRMGGTLQLQGAIRVIVSSCESLEDRVQDGKFREDLWLRLKRVSITIPALKEHSEDILPLAIQFAERSFRARGKEFKGFSPEAEMSLKSYNWPGNVHELQNAIERVALLKKDENQISVSELLISSLQTTFSDNGQRLHLVTADTANFIKRKKTLTDSFEKEYLMASLVRHNGNVSAAAREARLDRSNFLRLLRRHGLKSNVYRKAA